MPPSKTYRISNVIGTGAYGIVFRAVEASSGQHVALKKSRVSQRVKRTLLQYESRVLQLLQGHPAIPVVHGYGQLPHFEYLSMELLGPSVKDCAKGPVSVGTTTRIVLQTLTALEHIHHRGFVHRDIKPENILCSIADPSRIFLIDYGITRPIKPGPPAQYDPLAESRHIVGTLHWASLNAHNGIDLAPRDDLESLAYTAFFLLHGDLPWRKPTLTESTLKSMRRIHKSKAAEAGHTLGAGFPAEFGYLLDYSRQLQYDQIPDYDDLRSRFTRLIPDDLDTTPFDWNTVGTPTVFSDVEVASSEEGSESDSDSEAGGSAEEGSLSNSYFGWDISDWDFRQDERDRSLTLPAEQVEIVAEEIPRIVDVTQD